MPLKISGPVEPDCLFRNPQDYEQWYLGYIMAETRDGTCYFVRDASGRDYIITKQDVKPRYGERQNE